MWQKKIMCSETTFFLFFWLSPFFVLCQFCGATLACLFFRQIKCIQVLIQSKNLNCEVYWIKCHPWKATEYPGHSVVIVFTELYRRNDAVFPALFYLILLLELLDKFSRSRLKYEVLNSLKSVCLRISFKVP